MDETMLPKNYQEFFKVFKHITVKVLYEYLSDELAVEILDEINVRFINALMKPEDVVRFAYYLMKQEDTVRFAHILMNREEAEDDTKKEG